MAQATKSNPDSPFASIIDQHRPDLGKYEDFYKHSHAHPELANQEKETAASITKHLKSLSDDLKIQTDIGGHGQIAVLENGPGKTLLLRADIDALPVKEKSGVPYASSQVATDEDGNESAVMHACGHDFHFTALLAAAELLISARTEWSGTVVFLFQPAEEAGTGAQAMVDDGLYEKSKHACPVPDVLLAQHVMSTPAGHTGTRAGPLTAAGDSIGVTIFGVGGHGSMPHRCIDPVVIASNAVVALQNVVAREVPPNEAAVITVGSFHAGGPPNAIPDEATLKINVRTFTPKWRDHVLQSIRRVIKDVCSAGRCPKEPEFSTISAFPVTNNDAKVAATINEAFSAYFGDKHDPNIPAETASEDFSDLATAVDRPYLYWVFGGYDDKAFDHQVPANHSPLFAPVIQPTLQTGVDAMAVAVLSYLKK